MSNNASRLLTIAHTTDAALRAAAYRLRYDVIVREMGLKCSDREHRECRLMDDRDRTGHLLAAHLDDGSVAGTVMINFIRDRAPAALADLLALLGGQVPLDSDLSMSSRLIVAPSFRRSAVTGRLLLAVYQLALENGIHRDLIFAQPPLMPMYERVGYRRLSDELIDHPQAGATAPLVLHLRDWPYLRSIGSPFCDARSFAQF